VDRARYTKLIEDGSWGVWVNGPPSPQEGDVVEVTKADGTTKTEIIRSIVWQDEDGGRAPRASRK
jgi:hypothetical protein